MTKRKRMSDEERRASYDRASAISDRLERLVGYRGALADYETQRFEVSYDVMEQLLAAYESALLDTEHAAATRVDDQLRPRLPQKAGMKRCTTVGPAPERFRCGLWEGHDGAHTALIPSGVPWDPGPCGDAARAREGR